MAAWTETDEGTEVEVDRIGVGIAHTIDAEGVDVRILLRMEIDGELFDVIIDRRVAREVVTQINRALES